MNYLKVKGSYLEVGKQIGIAFKKEIKEYIDFRYYQMYSEMKKLGYHFLQNEYKIYAWKLENYIKENAKNEYQELMGISQVISKDISDIIFAIGYTDIFDLILERKVREGVLIETEMNNECSTFVINSNFQKVCGQNWDMDIVSKKNACIMHKEYSDGLKICAVTTILGLVHMGMNNIGISVGTANLGSKCVSASGVVFPIVIQNILKAQDREETLRILNKYKFVSGHYYYVMYPQEDPLIIETNAEGYHEITLFENIFVHTNHYVNEMLKKDAINYSRDSIKRKKAMEKYLKQDKIISEQYIKKILADHDNGICRHSDNKCDIVTASSVIFNPVERQMQVCNDAPCKGEWIVYNMNSIF